jgi:ubiquinone/menaquinone biosynthesis C-methylase UbiE
MANQEKKPEIKPAELCPWWICFTFDNFLRRKAMNPLKIMSSYIKEGMTVLDVGPGMGYFTISIAKLVGPSGKVIAADLQKHMLEAIHRRAVRAEVQERIVLHQTKVDDIGVREPVDFCLAFWMVHEVGDRRGFFNQIASILKPSGMFLFAEPKLHVSKANFTATVDLAEAAGLQVVEQPRIFFSYAAVMRRAGAVHFDSL